MSTSMTLSNLNPLPMLTYYLSWGNEMSHDPMITIIRLALLQFQPEGTKIWIGSNSIWINQPGMGQGTIRTVMCQKHDDLHLLSIFVQKAVYQYFQQPNEIAAAGAPSSSSSSSKQKREDAKQTDTLSATGAENAIIKKLFERAIKGLEVLKRTYRDKMASDGIQNWINFLEGSVKVKMTPENINNVDQKVKETWKLALLEEAVDLLQTTQAAYAKREENQSGKDAFNDALEIFDKFLEYKQTQFEKILLRNPPK